LRSEGTYAGKHTSREKVPWTRRPMALDSLVPFCVMVVALPAAAASFGWPAAATMVFVLALAPALVLVDGAPPVFLMAAIPGAHVFSITAAGLGGLKVLTALTLACWAVGALMGRQSFRLGLCPLDGAVGGLFAVALVNIAVLSNGSVATTNLFLEYGGSLALYLFVRGTIYSSRYLNAALAAFVASSVVEACLALLRYAEGLGAHSEGLRRLSLPGGDVNDFAGILLMAAGIALGFGIFGRDRRMRLLWLAVLPVLGAAILLSYSRQVFVGAAVMLLVAVLLSRGVGLRIAGLAIIMGGALVGLTSIGTWLRLSTYVSRIGGMFAGNYHSTSGRNITWAMGWGAFRSHAWFGLGVSNFASPQDWYTLAARQHVPANFLLTRQQVHSFYLGWAVDAGIAGLIFLVPAVTLGWFYVARSAWVSRAGSNLYALSQGLLLGLTGFLVAQAATPTQSDQVPYIVLAMAGCTWAALKGQEEPGQKRVAESEIGAHPRRWRWRLKGTVAAGMLGACLLLVVAALAVVTHVRLLHAASAFYLPFAPCRGQATHSHCLTGFGKPTVASALMGDSRIPLSKLKEAELRANVGYIWGAVTPTASDANARLDHFLPWGLGWCPSLAPNGKCRSASPPSIEWLRRWHPTWIEWTVNADGTPSAPAGTAPDELPVLDFTNPALQRYWAAHYVLPYLKLGYDGIAWNAPIAYDLYRAAGHFNARHRFIRQYSGSVIDPRWGNAQARAVGDLLRRVRATEPRGEFTVGASVDCAYAPTSVWRNLIRNANAVVDEEGYSNWGASAPRYLPATPGKYCVNRWLFKTRFYIRMQRSGEQLVLVNLQPHSVHPFMTDTNRRVRADLEWAMANYLLVKTSHTYFWFGGPQQYGYPVATQREELAHLGWPLGGMRQERGIYLRRYSSGMALVNPGYVPITVTPYGGKYEDLYGQRLNRVTMRPHSGLVLVSRTSVPRTVSHPRR
jgi:hypothetical protein